MKRLEIAPWVAIFGCIVMAMVMLSASAAQTERTAPSSVPDSLSPDAINALVSRLEPDQVAALGNLVSLLGRDAESLRAATAAPTTAELLSSLGESFGAHVMTHVQRIPELISGSWNGISAAFEGRTPGGSALFLGTMVLLIVVGAGGEWSFNRATAAKRDEIRAARPQGLKETLATLGARAGIELGGLVAFIVTALIANRLLVSEADDRQISAAFLLQAILVMRVVAALMRFVLAPKRPELRLVAADDETAGFLYRGFVCIAGVVGVAFFLSTVTEAATIYVTDTLRFWVGLFLNVALIFVIWKARKGMTSILIGEEEDLTPGLQRMATWWPWVTMAILVGNWLVLQLLLSSQTTGLPPSRAALAIALIVVAPFLDTVVRGIAAHLVPPMQGEGEVAEQAHRETKFSYVRIGRVVLLTVLILAVGKLWGVSLQNLPEDGIGAALAADGVGSLLIIAVGYLLWEVLNLWVNRQLANDAPPEAEQAEGAEMGGAGGSRIATILPVLHITLQITILTLTVLLALAQLGVNITPLLAGAGVFGLAIGFGAQALVKDIVSGIFFLMDDAFRIGEFIDAGDETMGTVEKISIRSLQLRGHTGPVHIVPYGEMSKLTNLSRDWVIMKLRFTVPFDTDLEKVRKLFKKIGQQMMETSDQAENMLEPFKSQGVADVTDVGIVIRGKFTAKPGTQFMIRKEVYTRVQKAFEENDIEFARREVRVKMPEGVSDASHSPEQAALAAAANAVTERDAAQAAAGRT